MSHARKLDWSRRRRRLGWGVWPIFGLILCTEGSLIYRGAIKFQIQETPANFARKTLDKTDLPYLSLDTDIAGTTTKLLSLYQSVKPLPVAEDFFQNKRPLVLSQQSFSTFLQHVKRSARWFFWSLFLDKLSTFSVYSNHLKPCSYN